MHKKNYYEIISRLIDILSELSNKKILITNELAQEYGTFVRMIQKDTKERLC